MRRITVWLLVFVMTISVCACGSNKEGEEKAEKASEMISDTVWGSLAGEAFGEDTYHILLFTNGADGYGDIEFFIQLGDMNIFQVRGRYIVSTENDNIIEMEYDEQLHDGTWGDIDEGRIDHDQFKYVMENGEIVALYRVNEDGDMKETFIKLED